MTCTSASCAGTVSPGGCPIPSGICRRCARGTCCLTRRVRGRNRSCCKYSNDATLYCLLHPHEHFPVPAGTPDPRRARARPRTHLRVQIGWPRARARLRRLPSRLRVPLIPLQHRARLPSEKAQGLHAKRQKATRAGGGSRPSLCASPSLSAPHPEPEANPRLSLHWGPASPTRVPRRHPCPPLLRQQPAAGAHSSRAPQTRAFGAPDEHQGETRERAQAKRE
ncbi:hypothetical protein B0H14DRAFT_2980875, partial [Mycena olivaceomarginata]